MNERIEVIEYLRGIAALAVAWFHFTNGGQLLNEGWLKSSGTYGYLGVEVFFVISGFVIPYAMGRAEYSVSRHFGSFMAKRLIRLEPPYLCSIVVTVALWHLSVQMPGFRGTEPSVTTAQILFHIGYLAGFTDYPWVIPVFWSLALEFQFYILVGILFPVLFHRVARVRVAALCAFVLLSFAMPERWPTLFAYAALFAMGMVTYWRWIGYVGNAAFLALLGILLVAALARMGAPIAMTAAGGAIAILFVKLPSMPRLSQLGAISYSVYLLHVPIGGRIVNAGTRFAQDTGMQVLTLVAAVGASLAAAMLLYVCVERPAQRLAARISYRRRSTPDQQAQIPTLELRDRGAS